MRIDRDRAASLGVSIEEISQTLQILFGGQDLSKVKRDGKEYDVIVRLDRESRLTPAHVERLYVRNSVGNLTQLSNVVSLHPTGGANAIFHYNRDRSATIEGTPMGIPLGNAMDRTLEILAEMLPAGFRVQWAGHTEDLRIPGGRFTSSSGWPFSWSIWCWLRSSRAWYTPSPS